MKSEHVCLQLDTILSKLFITTWIPIELSFMKLATCYTLLDDHVQTWKNAREFWTLHEFRKSCWVSGLCTSSGVLRKRKFRKLGPFSSSGERGESTYTVGPIRELTSVSGPVTDIRFFLRDPKKEKVPPTLKPMNEVKSFWRAQQSTDLPLFQLRTETDRNLMFFRIIDDEQRQKLSIPMLFTNVKTD
jgi:hypothetical protein